MLSTRAAAWSPPTTAPSTAGPDCEATYWWTARTVDLIATPDPGKRLVNWYGDCSGAAGCRVRLDLTNQRAVVEAKFGPPPTTAVKGISLGHNFGCALVDEQAICWGSRFFSQVPASLGTASAVSAGRFGCALVGGALECWGGPPFVPDSVETDPIANAVSLSVGEQAVCVVTEQGGVECRGGTYSGAGVPPAGLAGIVTVDVGQTHACAHDGVSVTCWGANSDGQTDVPALEPVREIGAGHRFTCVLESYGRVRCFGRDNWGQASVPADLLPATDIAVGGNHACALTEGGVRCWGLNTAGQSEVPPNLTGVQSIHAGLSHTCAQTLEQIHCWGSNVNGESTVWYAAEDFGVGNNLLCAVVEDGQVRCIGSSNQYGQLDVPVGLQGATAVGVGRFHACAWDGATMHCWGSDVPPEPVTPPADLTGVSDIDADGSYTCVVANGALRCWGINFYGLMNVPPGIDDAVEVSAGRGHACAVRTDSAHCWGDNRWGQAGSWSNLDTPVAVAAGGLWPNSSESGHSCVADAARVRCLGTTAEGATLVPPGLGPATDVAAGWGYSCAIAGGAVHCWGTHVTVVPEIRSPIALESDATSICAREPYRFACWGNYDATVLLLMP